MMLLVRAETNQSSRRHPKLII